MGKKEEITELLKIVCCPYCSGELKLEDDKVVCINCRRIYKIKNGILILL